MGSSPTPGTSSVTAYNRPEWCRAVTHLRPGMFVIAETEPPAWGRVYGLTVRQAAQSWLDRKAHDCAVSTAVTYRRLVAKICDGLGDVVVGELSVAMVDEFERGLLDRGAQDGGALSAKSVLAVHAVLHQILDDAVRRGVVTANVAASASPPRHEAAVVTVWTNDEVRRFLEVAARIACSARSSCCSQRDSPVANLLACDGTMSISTPARSSCVGWCR